jgi:hypothetical protein
VTSVEVASARRRREILNRYSNRQTIRQYYRRKQMKQFHKVLLSVLALSAIAVLFAFSGPVGASAKDTKSTGKKCAFCHDGAPKNGKLTKEGECYKKNGNKKGNCW